jgi:hypothetical protein
MRNAALLHVVVAELTLIIHKVNCRDFSEYGGVSEQLDTTDEFKPKNHGCVAGIFFP